MGRSHGASLDEIAEEAGYTTGAVYSNFKGKDDLFLAVLDAEALRRLPHHVELLLEGSRSVEEWARRWGLEFTMPAREVVRGTYALSRGMGLELLLSEEPGTTTQYEEMFLAYAMGLLRPRTGADGPGKGRQPRPRPPRPPALRPRRTGCGP
jgi:AcrR family transcriptional regulator